MRPPLATDGLYQPDRRAVAREYKAWYADRPSNYVPKAVRLELHAAEMRSRPYQGPGRKKMNGLIARAIVLKAWETRRAKGEEA